MNPITTLQQTLKDRTYAQLPPELRALVGKTPINLDTIDFASGTKKCKKGVACGGGCIQASKKCRKTMSPVQAGYAGAVAATIEPDIPLLDLPTPTPEEIATLEQPAEPTTPQTAEEFIAAGEKYLGEVLANAEGTLADLSARYNEARNENPQDRDKTMDIHREIMRSPELAAVANKVLEVTKPGTPEYEAATAAVAKLTIDSSAVTDKLTPEYYQDTMTKVFALTGNQGADALDTIKYTRDTPSASQLDRRLNVGKLDDQPFYKTRDLFHEAGHFVEYGNPGAKAAALDFVKARATGELMDLSKMGYKSADPNAKAYPMPPGTNPYMGRVYADGSTEVISTGLERMSNPASMAGFMAEDRQHFLFMVGVLRAGKQ